MKKSLILLFSVIALFAFVATSFALHAVPENFEYVPAVVKSKKAQIELGGSIRMRGIYEENNDLVDASGSDKAEINNDQEANYDSRIRLHTKATVSPNTMGLVELETGTLSSADVAWGTCGEGSQGVYQDSNCKDTELTVRQAYIAHQGTGLGVLSGFKVGHMLFALGNGLFVNHTDFGDDAFSLWISPADGTEIAFTVLKFTDTATAGVTNEDADVYVLSVESGINSINIGGDVTYLHDNTGSIPSLYDPNNTDQGLKLWNIGVRGDVDLGGVMIKGDVEFQTGEIEEVMPGDDDMDVGGWAVMVGADVKLGEVNVGGAFGYGSGDDIDTEDDYEGFVTSLASGQRSTFLADYRLAGSGQAIVAGSPAGGVSSTGGSNKEFGLNNHWYLTVGADAKVHPDIKVGGDIYYLSASEKVADSTATADLDEKDMGWEIDAKVTYQIDTNLVYYVEGGYLIAGDFYKNHTKGKDKDNFGNNAYSAEPDNAYTVRHGLVLSF